METLEDFGISILSMLISIGDIPAFLVNYQWASVHSSQCLSIGNSDTGNQEPSVVASNEDGDNIRNHAWMF